MRKLLGSLAVLVVLGVVAVGVFLYVTTPKRPDGQIASSHQSEQSFAEVQRGLYLTTVADCAACHTDPHGGQPFAGGRKIETPFGLVAAPNITPDLESGIGSWSDDDFANALQKGFSKDGHNLYPAMPYVYYTKLSRSDVDAIHDYLRTVLPVKKQVKADLLPFPLNIRLGMRFWNLLYFKEGRYKPDAAKSAQWNRGAYLVTGAEHCGACHTPKSIIGGDELSKAYQGNIIQAWYAPNLTDDKRRGLGSWSVADVVRYLKTGHNKFAGASGPMAEEVDHSSSRMPDDDLTAIAVFLKSNPGQSAGVVPVAADTPSMEAGKAIYDDSCAACHHRNGHGVNGLFPALSGSHSVQSERATSLMRVVLEGAKSVATPGAPTGPAMPSYNWQLKDDQVAAVLTYIRNSWGNQAPAVTAGEVASMRKELDKRPD